MGAFDARVKVFQQDQQRTRKEIKRQEEAAAEKILAEKLAAEKAAVVATSRAAGAVDVKGVSIGMPLAELKQLFQAKKSWRCAQVSSVFKCLDSDNPSVQDIKIQIANALPNTPIIRVDVVFLTYDNPIPSLVQKYGQPGWASGGDAKWPLRNGSMLELQSGGATRLLFMTNQALSDANTEAARRQAVPYSTPKF
jgi:hypothetical protein